VSAVGRRAGLAEGLSRKRLCDAAARRNQQLQTHTRSLLQLRLPSSGISIYIQMAICLFLVSLSLCIYKQLQAHTRTLLQLRLPSPGARFSLFISLYIYTYLSVYTYVYLSLISHYIYTQLPARCRSASTTSPSSKCAFPYVLNTYSHIPVTQPQEHESRIPPGEHGI